LPPAAARKSPRLRGRSHFGEAKARENSERRRSRTAENRKKTRRKTLALPKLQRSAGRLEPYFNFGEENFLIL